MPSPTLRTCLGHSLTKAFVVFLVAAALLVPASMRPSNRDAPETSDLFTNPGCWTSGEGHPAPSEVVVQVGGRFVVRGGKVVNDAIEQTMFGIDHGLHVVEFCA